MYRLMATYGMSSCYTHTHTHPNLSCKKSYAYNYNYNYYTINTVQKKVKWALVANTSERVHNNNKNR